MLAGKCEGGCRQAHGGSSQGCAIAGEVDGLRTAGGVVGEGNGAGLAAGGGGSEGDRDGAVGAGGNGSAAGVGLGVRRAGGDAGDGSAHAVPLLVSVTVCAALVVFTF